jgi:hypothetical protein
MLLYQVFHLLLRKTHCVFEQLPVGVKKELDHEYTCDDNYREKVLQPLVPSVENVDKSYDF